MIILYSIRAYRKFIEKPVSVSVKVRTSMECTPGDTARKSILTD